MNRTEYIGLHESEGEINMDNKTAIETIQSLVVCGMRSGKRQLFEALKVAIEALESAEPKWIPITEGMELPEHDVICCDNEGNIALGYLYFDEEENQIACDHDPYVMFGVVAYMELPEPYKGE